jgi:hypothetical protein
LLSQISKGSRIMLRDELDRLARVELFLHLALELRVEDARREHEAHAPADVLLLQLDAARQQGVVVDEGLHRLEHAGAQAGFVGAAGAVGIRLT